MLDIPSLAEADLQNKCVLLRVDLNIPQDKDQFTDITRLQRILPTLHEILSRGARVVLLSHLGQPKGKQNIEDSLEPLLPLLNRYLDQEVLFFKNVLDSQLPEKIRHLNPGQVALLENMRFYGGEESNDSSFVEILARLGDIYVNDSFSTAHRAHASTEGLAHALPAYAGRALEKELKILESLLGHFQRPLMAIVGGKKISTKLSLLKNLIPKVDYLMIGGAMAHSFLAAQGKNIGASFVETPLISLAEIILRETPPGCTLLLPKDVCVASEFKPGTSYRYVAVEDIKEKDMILDIGPESLQHACALLQTIRTLVWNGPLGAFECPPFDSGTRILAHAIAEATRHHQLLSVVGGGDTLSALRATQLWEDDFTYLSTGGGAFLKWLEGESLPSVAALKRKNFSLSSPLPL